MTTVGPWVSSPSTTVVQEVIDYFYGYGEYYYPSTSYLSAGGSWAEASEAGYGIDVQHHPPKRASYALFARVGELEYGSGDWAAEGVDPPDGYAVELNPFNLDLNGRITSIALDAPELPDNAYGWEFEGYPRDVYGDYFVPYLEPGQVSSAQVRATLEVNRVAVSSGEAVEIADEGWTWITTPVAGVAGPQHVVARYDGPGFTVSTTYAHLSISWSGFAGEGTLVQASSGVDDSYLVFDFTIELGPEEYLSEVVVGYLGDSSAAAHWSVPYVGGLTDYLVSNIAVGDTPLFLPRPLKVQLRMLPIDGGSKWRTGATLAGYPLLYEHTTAGELNESVDTGWVNLDPTTTANGLYVHYAEQVSHSPIQPAVLPARKPRHYHYNSVFGYSQGQAQMFGSTVAFERPEESGGYERVQLRLTYAPPRVRFLLYDPINTGAGGGGGWTIGAPAWG